MAPVETDVAAGREGLREEDAAEVDWSREVRGK
jgi:hypothetical protein